MRGLFGKLILIIGGIFLILMVATISLVYTLESREIEQDGLARAETLNRMAFEALYASMREGGGRQGNLEVISRLERVGAFRELRVIKGEPVIRQFGASPYDLPRDDLERRALQGEVIRRVTVEDGYRVVRYLSPVRVQPECQRCHIANVGDVNGVIVTEISLQDYEAALRHQRNILIAVVGAGLVLLALFTFFGLRRFVVRPLAEIQAGAATIARGDLSHRIDVRTGDEIEALAREFNRMAEQLADLYAGLEQRVEERTRELEALNRIALIVNRSLDVDAILPEVLDEVLAFTGARAADIRLFADGKVTIRSARGVPPGFIAAENRQELAQCMCFQVAQDGRPRRAQDLAREYPGARPCLGAGFRAGISVPIWVEDRHVGVLHIAFGEDQGVDDELQNTLLTVGHYIGLAVEKARLYEEERNQRQLANTLREASQLLNASLDLEAVLHTLLEQLARVLIIDVGLILLREGDMLRVAAVRGRPDLQVHRLLGKTLPITANPGFHQVVQDRTVYTFCQVGRKPPFAEGLRPIEEVDWCMVVPLMRGDEVIGLLALEQLDHCYDMETEPRIAMAFANHAVVAVENARLYHELATLNAELEARVQERTRELEEARQALALYADQLRELLNLTIQVQEDERDRIAREIHDSISQLLVGAMYELQAARVALRRHPEEAEAKFRAAQEILKRAKEEIRRVIYDLYPVVLVESGLVPALEMHLKEWSRMTGIEAHLNMSGRRYRLSARAERAVYRIVQEALHNVAQHAQASRVWVNLEFGDDALTVRVADNGRGFSGSEEVSRPHLGLIGMRERAESTGGTFRVESTPGRGTCVVVTIPAQHGKDGEVGETDHSSADSGRPSHRAAGVAQPAGRV